MSSPLPPKKVATEIHLLSQNERSALRDVSDFEAVWTCKELRSTHNKKTTRSQGKIVILVFIREWSSLVNSCPPN